MDVWVCSLSHEAARGTILGSRLERVVEKPDQALERKVANRKCAESQEHPPIPWTTCCLLMIALVAAGQASKAVRCKINTRRKGCSSAGLPSPEASNTVAEFNIAKRFPTKLRRSEMRPRFNLGPFFHACLKLVQLRLVGHEEILPIQPVRSPIIDR